MRFASVFLYFWSLTALAQVNPSTALMMQDRKGAPGLDSSRFQVRPLTILKQIKPQPKKVKRKPASVEALPPLPSDRRLLPPPVVPESLSRFELALGAGYFSNESQSDSYARSYDNHGPLMTLQARAWPLPSLGLNLELTQSSGATIKNDLTGASSPATHKKLEGGLRIRKVFGPKRTSPAIIAGMDWREYRFDSGERGGSFKTTGFVLKFETELPHSEVYATRLLFQLDVHNVHSEIPQSSGTRPRSDGLGLGLGGILRLSSSNQLFWQLSHLLERNVFSGTAQRENPITGNKPQGVDVTNSHSQLILGYKWSY